MENQKQLNITQIVKNNTVQFAYYRAAHVYYDITVDSIVYRFPVELSDVGNGTLNATDKAIAYMRWINKAIKEGTFIAQ
jgi:hypothetical protein